MTKIIKCAKCNEYLGEIRDATLRKGAVFMCGICVTVARPRREYKHKHIDSLFNTVFGNGKIGD